MARRRNRKTKSTISEQIVIMLGVGVFLAVFMVQEVTRFAEEHFGNYLIIIAIVAMVLTWIVGGIVFKLLNYLFKKPSNENLRTDNSFVFDDMSLSKLSPSDFENEVARLIQSLTGRKTEVCGGAGDGGVDIKVINDKGQLVGIVQCKRYKPGKSIPPAHIRELNTVKHTNQVNTAYLVTTANFSDASIQLAKELGVKLIAGKDLEKLRRQVELKAKQTG